MMRAALVIGFSGAAALYLYGIVLGAGL